MRMESVWTRETPSPRVAPIVTGHFREGASYATWRTNGTSDWLLMLTLAGMGRIGHGSGDIIAQAGDVLLLAPGTRHDYSTAGTIWEILWVHFLPRPHWADWLGWPAAAEGVFVLPLPPEARQSVEEALREMNRWASSGLPRRVEFAMNALERALLWCDAANPRRAEAHIDPRIRRAMERMLEDLREPLSLPEIAASAGLSTSRLSHLFRQQVGQTPQQFAERARLERARQLLSLTGRSVASVAEEVGFVSPFYFTLRFKKATGMSPTEWRQTMAP